MSNKIKNATAIYTGGNIYIYYGQLTDGNYFRACDDWYCIEICDADTSTDDADYNEWLDKHRVEMLEGYEYEIFWNKMLRWIIDNKPKGNFQSYELEHRFIEVEEEKVTLELTQEELIDLSNGMIALIKNNGDAMKLIHDSNILELIKEANGRYTALNRKICNEMRD